jgi:MFS family permease
MGLRPDGDAAPLPAQVRPSNVVDPAWASIDWTVRRAMRTARFWWLALSYFCALYAWYAVQVHQTKYLQEIGFSANRSAWALGLVSLIGVAGQISLGHVSDRIGREWIWVVSNVGFVLCFLALIVLQHDQSMVLL